MSDKKPELKVTDKRHWVDTDESARGEEGVGEKEADLERLPTHVEELKKQAEAAEEKLKEYIAAYKKKMAENDEFRARLQKDVDGRVETKVAELLCKALPALDHLALAKGSALKNRDMDKLMEGIDMIQSELMRAFIGLGMKEVHCLGEEFDPSFAEAVLMTDVTEEEKAGKILEIVQPGYTLNEKLVRPAKVIVGSLKEKP